MKNFSLCLFLSLSGFQLDRCFLFRVWRKIKHKSRCEVCVCMSEHLSQTEEEHVACAPSGHFYRSWKKRERMKGSGDGGEEILRERNKLMASIWRFLNTWTLTACRLRNESREKLNTCGVGEKSIKLWINGWQNTSNCKFHNYRLTPGICCNHMFIIRHVKEQGNS